MRENTRSRSEVSAGTISVIATIQDTGERVAGEARGKRLGQGGGHGRIRGESGLWIFEL